MNNSKTWLVVKPEVEIEAWVIFQDSQINITSEGCPYLGVLFGRQAYIESFVHSKVDQWRSIRLSLADVASSSPHVVYTAFTHEISSLWTFLHVLYTPQYLTPLKDLIRTTAN